jgi:hypothetical protein
MVWHGPDEDARAAQLQVAHTRIAVLEDRIRMHRLMVRDGWVSPHRPDREANTWLWSALGDEHEPR